MSNRKARRKLTRRLALHESRRRGCTCAPALARDDLLPGCWLVSHQPGCIQGDWAELVNKAGIAPVFVIPDTTGTCER